MGCFVICHTQLTILFLSCFFVGKEVVMLVTVLGGSIGFLVFSLLVVTAIKTFINHYGRIQ